MSIDLRAVAHLSALVNEAQKIGHKPNPAKEWYNIATPVNDVTAIYLYEEIGGWFGIGATDFVAELNAITTTNIDLHINSGGGSIFDGVAIMTALARHSAEITVYVDGIAASAASFIAMAGDRIVMEPAATMMIHDGLGSTLGNEADHLKSAAILGKLSDTIASVYARRAGGDLATWRETMRAETWYNAEEAVAAGLADEVGEISAPDAPAEPPTARTRVFPSAVVTNTLPATVEPVTADPDPAPEPVAEFDERAWRLALLAANDMLTRA